MNYLVAFEITVSGNTPEQAAKQGWRSLLTMGVLPTAMVVDENGEATDVDLEQLEQEGVTE